jgi:flavodoxin
MKTCVIFYSYSGVTRGVAESLAASCGADLIEVHAKNPYSKLTAYTVGCMRARRGDADPIDRETIDVSSYDLVIIGTPVWAFRAAPPVNAAIAGLSGCSGKKAVLFATCGGKAGDTLQELKKTLINKGLCIMGDITFTKKELDDNRKTGELAALVKAAEQA